MRLSNVRTRQGPRLATVDKSGRFGMVGSRSSGALRGLRTVDDVVAGGRAALAAVTNRHKPRSPRPSSAARLAPPLLRPNKIVAIGLNYRDHCLEQGIEPPERPLVFAKFPSSLIGARDPIRWSRSLTKRVDWEAELGFIIGKKARNVAARTAMEHVFGYVAANDVTARDLQRGDGQWVRGKSLDTFCPLGPFVVTADEVDDPHDLKISSRVNGRTMQESNTSNLIFNVPRLVEFVSKAFTLWPGDLVLTGTPPGVGTYQRPPRFLKNNDVVEVEVGGLGTLRNRCLVSA